MPEYLLPCACGARMPVSTAQAGNTLRCACGSELHVPTLRGLGALETASPAAKSRTWEDRHRVAFVLVLVSLACLAVAVYLRLTLPPPAEPIAPEEVSAVMRDASAGQLFGFYTNMLNEGLGPPPSNAIEETRRRLYWGMGIAVAAAVAAQAGALAAVLRRKRR